MDKLSRYIKTGKRIGFLKLFVVFLIIALGVGGLIGLLLRYTLQQDDFLNTVREIPQIEIENGLVQKPKETVWTKDFADDRIRFRIDTTRNESNETFENGIVLNRSKVYLFFRGQTQSSDLPTDKIVIDENFILKVLMRGIISFSLFVGAAIFLFLFIGYVGTLIGVRSILWCFQKKIERDVIHRSVLVGWVSVFILNFGLTIFGHGFQFPLAVLLSILIAVFCAFQVGSES